jgi:hypothetical protein
MLSIVAASDELNGTYFMYICNIYTVICVFRICARNLCTKGTVTCNQYLLVLYRIYLHANTHICVYIWARTHTHTHTHTQVILMGGINSLFWVLPQTCPCIPPYAVALSLACSSFTHMCLYMSLIIHRVGISSAVAPFAVVYTSCPYMCSTHISSWIGAFYCASSNFTWFRSRNIRIL